MKLEISSAWEELSKTKTWPEILAEVAQAFPDREALVFRMNGTRISFTYREYANKVDELARGLYAIGVRKGDHVALWMTNRPEWCFARLAIYKLGAIMIPLHTRYRLEELQFVLKQSDTQYLLFEDQFFDRIESLNMLNQLIPEIKCSATGKVDAGEFPVLTTVVCLSNKGEKYPGTYSYDEVLQLGSKISNEKIEIKHYPADTIHVIYTSGTTGFPKGVETPSSCNVAYCAVSKELYHLTGKSKYLNVMPFFGNIGLWNHTLSLLAGCTLITDAQVYDPVDVLATIEAEGITHAIFVPTILLDILNHPDYDKYNLKSLQRITCSGAPVPQNLIRMIKEKLGLYLMNIYGLSEASGLSTWVPYGDTPEHVEKTVGLAMPHCMVGILDPNTEKKLPPGVEGEICTREVFPGSQHMKGYYKRPELTREVIRDGWLHSGDLGKMDAEGYIYLTGRLKEMFTVGGFNVSPAEVENFLLKHPKVANVAVVGVPEPRLGEVGAAFIKLKTGQNCSEEEITAYCKDKVANIKVPRYVFFVNEFPLNPQGKVQKFKLREMACEKLGYTG